MYLSYLEMWDICRKLRPDISEREFAKLWLEFLAMKAKRKKN